MDNILISVSPDLLQLDESEFPDRDSALIIYEHLKYYVARTRDLQAIFVSGRRIPPVVVSGHTFLKIATEIGISKVKAIVVDHTDSWKLRKFLSQPGVQVLDLRKAVDEADRTLVASRTYMFFFDAPLSAEQKLEFDNRIVGFFRNLRSPILPDGQRHVSDVQFAFEDTCAEFSATVTVADESWGRSFDVTCLEFDKQVASIASFQGQTLPFKSVAPSS